MSLRHLLPALASLTLLAACAEEADPANSSPAAAPTQPGDEAEGGKTDAISKDAIKTDADESLKSSRLRRVLCDAALAAPNTFRSTAEAAAFDDACTQQTFTVTAFWSHAKLIEDGAPALIAMDVRIETTTPQGYTLNTRLTRDVSPTSLAFTWQGHLLSVQTSAPGAQTATSLEDIATALNNAGGRLAESTVAHQFTPVDPDNIPEDVDIAIWEEIDNRVSDQGGVVLEAEAWYRIDADSEHLGWAAVVHEWYNPNDQGDGEAPDPETLEEVGYDLYLLNDAGQIVDGVNWKP